MLRAHRLLSASSSLLRGRARLCKPLTTASASVSVPATNTTVNAFGQTVGVSLPDWTPPSLPSRATLVGRYCQLEPLDPHRHLDSLWTAQCEEPDASRWTYLTFGPFESRQAFESWCLDRLHQDDPLFFAIVVDGQALGMLSYLRMKPTIGAIEVGHLYYAPRLSKTRAATEALYLLADHAFQLGYRRYEWRCDRYNYPSRVAAARLGFTYEGLFRQAMVTKGRDRDTLWFSILDQDWHQGLDAQYQRWLDPENFDESGKQKQRLSELTAPFVHEIR